MANVGIISLGHYLPERRLTNADLAKMVETSDEWITSRTGIKERRIAGTKEKTSDMAIGAAREALEKSGLDPAKVELIIVATISPDSNFPSMACLVQKAIGAKKATAFDISAACSGFLYALTTAKQFIQSGFCKNALVIASEKISNLIDWNDRSTCVLFGDGAGACLLGTVRAPRGVISEYLHAQGQFGDLMTVKTAERHPLDQHKKETHLPYVVMQGQELFKVAVNSMAEAVQIAAKKAKIKLSDIDWVVPHQANDRIISAVAKKLNFPKEKIFVNIDKYGNMSAASIAVALYEAVEQQKIKKGDHVVLVAFGAGLVSAANVVRW
ncbi:MAG TPA: 3-oxoacyl-ACP synthase [Candidatus Omnitrophica bacterium]|nr:MAG: 3-oxoacyl-ACP synthase [Omnitrophica WOR_2 bacterium GWA2_45_18]OGX18691.1 MAG: 3-oxoacyl-ACP synthase [Omnitrophica WOR_2 bacterium GWC2_45_7]HBR15570.1 3-oxoacyl-ACP synthase [Candidatus Omnitrophota bacterium]